MDSSEAGEYWSEEIQKHQGQILIIKELPVLMGFGVMKAVQYFEEDVQILESQDILFPERGFLFGPGLFRSSWLIIGNRASGENP